jgi:hypothetical protein
MIKETKLFYPHIVKQYDNLGQMISDNNYTSYYDMVKQVLVDAGIDTSDNAVYQESLTDDKFEGIVTVVYPDADAITAVESALQSNMESFSNPQPIFEEVVTDHLF